MNNTDLAYLSVPALMVIWLAAMVGWWYIAQVRR